MSRLNKDELVEIVLGSLSAERDNNLTVGKALMHPEYRKTGMYVQAGELFPVLSGKSIEPAMKEAYAIKGKEFHIFNIVANEDTQTVFLELVEVEPQNTGRVVWPYVMICYIEDDKIKRTRHYGDPALARIDLSVDQIKEAIEA